MSHTPPSTSQTVSPASTVPPPPPPHPLPPSAPASSTSPPSPPLPPPSTTTPSDPSALAPPSTAENPTSASALPPPPPPETTASPPSPLPDHDHLANLLSLPPRSLQILFIVLSNLLKFSSNSRYRTIRFSNSQIREHIRFQPSSITLLCAVAGFEVTDEGLTHGPGKTVEEGESIPDESLSGASIALDLVKNALSARGISPSMWKSGPIPSKKKPLPRPTIPRPIIDEEIEEEVEEQEEESHICSHSCSHSPHSKPKKRKKKLTSTPPLPPPPPPPPRPTDPMTEILTQTNDLLSRAQTLESTSHWIQAASLLRQLLTRIENLKKTVNRLEIEESELEGESNSNSNQLIDHSLLTIARIELSHWEKVVDVVKIFERMAKCYTRAKSWSFVEECASNALSYLSSNSNSNDSNSRIIDSSLLFSLRLLLGRALNKQKKFEDALIPLSKARASYSSSSTSALPPSSSQLVFQLAISLFNLRQFADAERVLSEYLATSPQLPHHKLRIQYFIRILRGQCRGELGTDPDGMTRDFISVLDPALASLERFRSGGLLKSFSSQMLANPRFEKDCFAYLCFEAMLNDEMCRGFVGFVVYEIRRRRLEGEGGGVHDDIVEFLKSKSDSFREAMEEADGQESSSLSENDDDDNGEKKKVGVVFYRSRPLKRKREEGGGGKDGEDDDEPPAKRRRIE